jgi:hypothetical protein
MDPGTSPMIGKLLVYPSPFVFHIRDNYSGAECVIGPCTCEERDNLFQLWSGETNDTSPFDDRWSFEPVEVVDVSFPTPDPCWAFV